jgi:hypothetical protein
LEYPTKLLPTGQLELDIRTRQVETKGSVHFGSDLSIHCPDFLLAQRYPPESQIPNQHGHLIVESFYSESPLAEEKRVWFGALKGTIQPPATLPYLIRGNFYVEPYHNFAYAHFKIEFEDDVIKSGTVPHGVTLKVQSDDADWTGISHATLVPATHLNANFYEESYVYWHSIYDHNLGVDPVPQLKYDMSKMFNTERPLSTSITPSTVHSTTPLVSLLTLLRQLVCLMRSVVLVLS